MGARGVRRPAGLFQTQADNLWHRVGVEEGHVLGSRSAWGLAKVEEQQGKALGEERAGSGGSLVGTASLSQSHPVASSSRVLLQVPLSLLLNNLEASYPLRLTFQHLRPNRCGLLQTLRRTNLIG